jgi:hypothetical protein
MIISNRLTISKITSAYWRVTIKNPPIIGTTTWPETQALIGKLADEGLQKEGDFELRLGYHVGHVSR